MVRFRKRNPIPEDREVFILDATANEDLLRAIFPDWTFQVWECPAIEQQGRIIQVMDYDISRSRLRKEIARHEDHNPSWLVQVIDNILEVHGPMPVITFKNVMTGQPEWDILGKLKYRDRITGTYNYPCRGHTIDSDKLLVVGTPYKDEAIISELAMAIWGPDGLPTTQYGHQIRENGHFVSKNMGYSDDHLRAIEEFVVSADLVQAIGRVRPPQRECTIFVISNAPVFDWEVEQFASGELFDMRTPLRKDASNTYRHFCEIADPLLLKQSSVQNSDVCHAANLSLRTGRVYWKKYKDDNRHRLEICGPAVRLLPA
jgi:hypothetical protein